MLHPEVIACKEQTCIPSTLGGGMGTVGHKVYSNCCRLYLLSSFADTELAAGPVQAPLETDLRRTYVVPKTMGGRLSQTFPV